MDTYDPEMLERLFGNMTPENAVVAIISSTNEGKTDLVEPIYESKYSIRDLTAEEIARFTTPDLSWAESGMTFEDLDLPEVNTSKNWRSRQFRNINIVVHDDMRDVDVEK